LKFSYILSYKENVFLFKVGKISENFCQTIYLGNILVFSNFQDGEDVD